MGRGGAGHRSPSSRLPVEERESPEEVADLYAFADAIERITEMGLEDSEAFGLRHRVSVPALDLFRGSHGRISRAHARLLRRCQREETLDRGRVADAVPVRAVDLDASPPHLNALVASIACLVQATTKSNPSAAIAGSVRDGLVAEGLADAYFVSRGWEPVSGIGAFYRDDAETFGARLIHGQGLDHLFTRRVGARQEYLSVETKMCKTETPLHRFLQHQFEGALLAEASAGSASAPVLSPGWVMDRLHRSYTRGAIDERTFRAAMAAIDTGRMQRVAVVVACPEYDRLAHRHVPNPDQLQVTTTEGRRRLADEVVTLRVPKAVLTTLVGEISSARAKSIALIVSQPSSLAARLWRRDG